MEREEEMKTKIDIDFDKLFKRSNREEGPPPELVVVGGSGKEGTSSSSSSSSFSVASDMDVLARSSDRDISDKIDRIRGQYKSLASKLPDKGAKLFIQVEQLEEEQKRRREFGFQKKAEAWDKPMQSQKFLSSGSACNGFVPDPKSFASCFSQQLEEKPDCSTHLKATAFHSKLSHLAWANQQNGQADGILPNKRKWEDKISSSQSPFRCSRSFNCNDKHRTSNGAKKVIAPSNFYQPRQDENLSNILSNRRKASGVHASSNLRKKNQTVVLVDEEDCQAIKTTENEDEPIRRETKFYYPSRDDPESVELCYSDMKHLAPEAFLSDSIMNFYIRYLQRPITATGKSQSDYHFFNTYFYKKLKEAVSYKGNDKDTFYSKFRRWWKGVNMFEKAYILLPIHEIQHWSLVIICMPDKEDESGPIILHLDSLGFHLSSQIFQNIKRFLTEEWSYLDKQVDSPNVPIAERIWRHLPRRIDEKAITVPQQKNDYDCGIFVLYYMERFIQEAPERLRRNDLAMFSKQWFRPEEASGLRKRIRSLLKEEFENASLENENKSREPSPDDSGDDPVDTVDLVPKKLGKNSRESSPMSSDDDLLDLTGMNKSRQSSSTYSDHYLVECDQDTYS